MHHYSFSSKATSAMSKPAIDGSSHVISTSSAVASDVSLSPSSFIHTPSLCTSNTTCTLPLHVLDQHRGYLIPPPVHLNLATPMSIPTPRLPTPRHRPLLDQGHSEPVPQLASLLVAAGLITGSTGDAENDPNGVQLSLKAAANLCRYKSELCRPFIEHGQCKYGDKCQFAHGRHELRSMIRHPKYKTDLCKTYHTTGLGPYGPRCHFIHNDEERKLSDINRHLIDQQRARLVQLQHRQQQQLQLSVQVRELQRQMAVADMIAAINRLNSGAAAAQQSLGTIENFPHLDECYKSGISLDNINEMVTVACGENSQDGSVNLNFPAKSSAIGTDGVANLEISSSNTGINRITEIPATIEGNENFANFQHPEADFSSDDDKLSIGSSSFSAGPDTLQSEPMPFLPYFNQITVEHGNFNNCDQGTECKNEACNSNGVEIINVEDDNSQAIYRNPLEINNQDAMNIYKNGIMRHINGHVNVHNFPENSIFSSGIVSFPCQINDSTNAVRNQAALSLLTRKIQTRHLTQNEINSLINSYVGPTSNSLTSISSSALLPSPMKTSALSNGSLETLSASSSSSLSSSLSLSSSSSSSPISNKLDSPESSPGLWKNQSSVWSSMVTSGSGINSWRPPYLNSEGIRPGLQPAPQPVALRQPWSIY